MANIINPMQDHQNQLIIAVEIDPGRQVNVIAGFFYREFTGSITGDTSILLQVDRWEKNLNFFSMVLQKDKDIILLGDANICWKILLGVPNCLGQLGPQLQNFLLENNLEQLVKDSRQEVVLGSLKSTCILTLRILGAHGWT